MKIKFIFLFIFLSQYLFCYENIILFGPPGSGKGTFCQKLCLENKHIQISPGDILRKEILNQTPLGNSIKEIVANGDYIEDSLMWEIIQLYLTASLKNDNFFILDGFPRSQYSLNALVKYIYENKLFDKITVLEFTIDDNIAYERIINRKVCPNCDTVYNVNYKMPLDKINCDKCNTPIIQRYNDTPEVIKKRQKHYHENIQPLIKDLNQILENKF